MVSNKESLILLLQYWENAQLYSRQIILHFIAPILFSATDSLNFLFRLGIEKISSLEAEIKGLQIESSKNKVTEIMKDINSLR